MARMPILLVEDNADDVELTLHAFRKSPAAENVHVARSGEEAIEYLFPKSANDPHPSAALVLLDLQLPGMSGLDVLQRIKQDPETRRIPVVILTTSDDRNDVTTGYDLGVNSYIRKPVNFETFNHLLGQIRTYWLSLNTPAPN